MTTGNCGLYNGIVTHERLRPVHHRLRYRIFQILVDLDELSVIGVQCRLFSHNRFNILSLFDRDHGDRTGSSLRGYVKTTLAAAGISTPLGRVQLLCMPRLFGYVFNPLSIYFCQALSGRWLAMIYEVNNTFGGRHSYVIATPETVTDLIEQTCDKAFFVSPFMDMDMGYRFSISVPDETLTTMISVSDKTGVPVLTAGFKGKRHPLTDKTILATLVRYPLMTVKVVLAIHWEAVKLILKGVKMRPKPRLLPRQT